MLETILLIIGLLYIFIYWSRATFAIVLCVVFYGHLDRDQKSKIIWSLLQSLGLGFILWYFFKLYTL